MALAISIIACTEKKELTSECDRENCGSYEKIPPSTRQFVGFTSATCQDDNDYEIVNTTGTNSPVKCDDDLECFVIKSSEWKTSPLEQCGGGSGQIIYRYTRR